MPAPDRNNLPVTNDSEQSILNSSFDEKYQVLATEMLGENPAGDALNRLKVNDSGQMQTSDPVAQVIASAVYDAQVRLQPYQNAQPYARDINDQMRVVIGSGTVTAMTQVWGNQSTYPSYYGTGGPNSVDPREQLELQSIDNFNNTRTSRWTF